MEDSAKVANPKEFSMIESMVTCSICLKIIIEPVQCGACENSFCKSCIEEWKKKSSFCPFKCPQFTVKPSRTIRNLLFQIKFTCPNCKEEISYEGYNKHINETCAKLDFKEKYLGLIKEFNAMSLELKELKQSNTSRFVSRSHVHPLVFNYVNRNGWTCNVCKSVFQFALKSSYICKICDFDLCEECKIKEEIRRKAH